MESLGMLSETGQVDSITLFVLLLTASIVIGHLLKTKRWFNESVTALLIGLATGAAILLTSKGMNSHVLQFNEQFFFTYLLPPIIFNAGFQVKKKQFFKNILPIMVYGVVGTLVSFSTIAFGASQLFKKLNIGFLKSGDYTAIGAILSATDSVCTLQILNQDETPLLYSLVFGEGVVNDATSVVVFKAIQKLDLSGLHVDTLFNFLGNLSTLLVSSTVLGIFVGLVSAFLMKTLFSGRRSTDREVILMALVAYFSYLSAELMNLSGILSVFFCGIVMSHYTWHSVSEESRVTTKHGFAIMSFLAESFIFLYVGMDALDLEKLSLVCDSLGVSSSLGASAILLALVLIGRAAFVFPLSFIVNLTTAQKISFKQQFVIWWSGLMRGAVSMALAYHQFATLGQTRLPGHALMITSTITIVLFSTMVFGALTKPLIKFLLLSSSSTLPVSFAPTSPNSLLMQSLLEHGQDDGDSHNVVHRCWRIFDDYIMLILFGGKPLGWSIR